MAFLQPNAWMTQRRISMPMGLRAALSHCKYNFPVSTSASMTRSEEIRQTRNLPQISSTFFRPGPTFLERVASIKIAWRSHVERRFSTVHKSTLQVLWGSMMYLDNCGTCHDTPNVGNHSVKAPLNIGIANAGLNSPPALDISGLPVFTLQCTQGPLAGQTFVVTDPGRALISGNCADIGKVKGPILRALAARAPYFHNGSAASLLDVVNFYDQRFGIGFTEQQKQDLVNFLNSL